MPASVSPSGGVDAGTSSAVAQTSAPPASSAPPPAAPAVAASAGDNDDASDGGDGGDADGGADGGAGAPGGDAGGAVSDAEKARRAARQKKKRDAAKRKAAAAKAAVAAAGGDAAGGAGPAGAGAAAGAAPPPPPRLPPTGVPSSRPLSRLLGGFTDYYVALGQTQPPSLPVASLFPAGDFPAGQALAYVYDAAASAGSVRPGAAEARAAARAAAPGGAEGQLRALREAAEVHRQVRAHAQSVIRPGVRLADMCEAIENMNRALVREDGLARGIAFPTGCSLNHVAAHYTPNGGDGTVLGEHDVMKVDFGTQVGGHIIDCAWTVSFDPAFDGLLEAVKAATEAGVAAAGVDARLGEVGAAIQEVMESHEVVLRGAPLPVRCLRNLNGHSIAPYRIHAGKSVPIVATADATRMEEGEQYAIETFGSVGGRGVVVEDGDCSHYMRSWEVARAPLKLERSRALLRHIERTFGTLAFCRRWLERPDGGSFAVHGNAGRQERYLVGLKELVDTGLVDAYPPLVEAKGAYTAQYEHTILLKPTAKEVLSRGDDY